MAGSTIQVQNYTRPLGYHCPIRDTTALNLLEIYGKITNIQEAMATIESLHNEHHKILDKNVALMSHLLQSMQLQMLT